MAFSLVRSLARHACWPWIATVLVATSACDGGRSNSSVNGGTTPHGTGGLPPVCDAGPKYAAWCQDANLGVRVDGSASFDPDGVPITYLWTTSCAGGAFDDPTAAAPLYFPPAAHCPVECLLFLTVSDGILSSSCQSSVRVFEPDALAAFTEASSDAASGRSRAAKHSVSPAPAANVDSAHVASIALVRLRYDGGACEPASCAGEPCFASEVRVLVRDSRADRPIFDRRIALGEDFELALRDARLRIELRDDADALVQRVHVDLDATGSAELRLGALTLIDAWKTIEGSEAAADAER